MSSVGIWSANLHYLRNSLQNRFSRKIFRFQTIVVSQKTFGHRRGRYHQISTNVGGRNQTPDDGTSFDVDFKQLDGPVRSSTINIKPNGYEFQSVEYLNIQRRVVDRRTTSWPAIVLVFDIETTGYSPKSERIVEIAIRDLLGGSNSTFQTLVNPEKFVQNSHVHSITTTMVTRPDVPRMGELIPLLIEYVRSRQISGKPVLFVAHNGRRFDVPFIVNEFQRCSYDVPGDWLFVDTLPLARQLVKPDGSKLPSVSLDALKEHFEIREEGRAHRAMPDVMALSLVLQKMSFELKISVAELMREAFTASDVALAAAKKTRR
ncbi:polynucleotidyl transferase, ribonuclease H-like superfamily protein isoform X2 [Wolffia australiana]